MSVSELASPIGSALVAGFKVSVELLPCLKCDYLPVQVREEKKKGKLFFRFECPNCDGLDRKPWMESKDRAAREWNAANSKPDAKNSVVLNARNQGLAPQEETNAK